jgi:FkbM family methyltransferase
VIEGLFKFGERVLEFLLYKIRFWNTNDKREPAPGWIKVIKGPLRDHYMFLDPHSHIYWHREMMEGQYDSFIYEVLSKCRNIEGATMWDIGAHIGYHSLSFAALVGPSGHVVAFEPNPYNINRFRKNSQRNPSLAKRITLMTCALSNVDGEASFVFSPEVDSGRSSGSHLDRIHTPERSIAYQSFSRTTVSTVKADTLLREECIPPPSIVKIDVEGAEVLVLEGSLGMLSTVKPTLFIEIHHVATMFYAQELLAGLGYNLKILDEEHITPSRCFIIAKPAGG